MFNENTLSQAGQFANQYRSASPFPHISLNNIVEKNICLELEDKFPLPESDIAWRNNTTTVQGNQKIAQINKLGFSDEWQLPDVFQRTFWAFNSGKFLQFLEEMTGIENLIPDPHFVGGGLHLYKQGAVLRAHADFNHHGDFRLDRRLNVLLYLNSNWKSDWKGQLELWNEDMTNPKSVIEPNLGSIAIFNTTTNSYHGMRGPLATPEDVYRKSLAFYYYTNGRDDGFSTETHSTLWQAEPSDVD